MHAANDSLSAKPTGFFVSDTLANTGGGAIGPVGAGDTLAISIMGPGGMEANVTVDADGNIVSPFLGTLHVLGETPAAIGADIGRQLKAKGYLEDAQVAVAVVTVRSRVVSILGQVAHPGRYPLDARLSVLELLAMAGGALPDAADTAVLVRRANGAAEQRIRLYVDNGQNPTHALQDTELRAGDVVFLPQAAKFYVYGEVGKPGAYPVEENLNVMRALSIAGGITERGSDGRIDLDHVDPATGKHDKRRVKLSDPVEAGDVIRVRERLF